MQREDYGPVAGLREAILEARSQAPGTERLLSLLADLRSGKPDAKKHLIEALQHLVYEGLDINRLDNLDLLSTRQIALHTAVDRLAKNKTTDPVKHVRDELHRAKVEYKREESPNIIPPSSTQATRRKNGLALYPTLKRKGDPVDFQGQVDIGPMMVDFVDELVTHYTTSEEESSVLQMLVEGYPPWKIAATRGTTVDHVDSIIRMIRKRVS